MKKKYSVIKIEEKTGKELFTITSIESVQHISENLMNLQAENGSVFMRIDEGQLLKLIEME